LTVIGPSEVLLHHVGTNYKAILEQLMHANGEQINTRAHVLKHCLGHALDQPDLV